MINKSIISNTWDFLLIIFPIWISAVYFALIKIFPENENIFFILFLIILGETHFGSTWLMYFEKKNIKWALNNKIYSIYYPILILFYLTTVAITISLNASLFIILLFNFFHVTRQSSGIIKIYLENEEERVRAILINNFLYLISLALVFFGLLKFVFKTDAIKEYNEIVNILSILFLGLSILYFWFFLRFKNLKAILCYITGVLIWMPLI